MKVPDAAAGKLVKCPNCETRTKVMASKVEADVDEEPRPRPKSKAARPIHDDEDRPVRKKARTRDEDDEEEERPRKKKTPAKSGNNKVLFLVLAAVGGLLIVGGGVTAAILLSRSTSTKPGGNTGVAGGSGNSAASQIPIANDHQVLSPRTKFAIEFGKIAGDRKAQIDGLFISRDGARLLVVGNTESGQSQVWDIRGEPKKGITTKGKAESMSDDGGVIFGYFGTGEYKRLDADTGSPTTVAGYGGVSDGSRLSFNSAKMSYSSSSSSGWDKAEPLRVFVGDPSLNMPSKPYPAGDDNRVSFSSPLKQGKEFMFVVPAQNKVRVFDANSKSVSREFPLANPREWRGGGPRNFMSWDGFKVHPDGKWIAVRRMYLAKDPDPLEFFDATGAAVAQLPYSQLSERTSAFIPGRDLYVGSTNLQFPDAGIAAFDLNRKEYTTLFKGRGSSIAALAVSADGNVMATVTFDNEVCIWDLTQLK